MSFVVGNIRHGRLKYQPGAGVPQFGQVAVSRVVKWKDRVRSELEPGGMGQTVDQTHAGHETFTQSRHPPRRFSSNMSAGMG